MFALSDSFNTQIQNMTEVPDNAKIAMDATTAHFPGVLDNSILVLMIGLSIAAMALASMVRIHPVFFVFFIIIFGIILFLTAIYSNIYQKLAENAQLAPLAAQMVFTQHILTYLPFIVGMLGFILSIIMYKNYKAVQ